MGDIAHITPEQASQQLSLENVDANLIDILARKDVVTFGSLVRVGLELVRDPTLAQETAPNTIKLSNKAINITKDFATRFPSILPLIKAGQSSPKGHFIFCSDSALISAITKWRFEQLPPSIILRTQAPPTPPAAKFTQQPPSTDNKSHEGLNVTSNDTPTQKKKPARRGKKKKAAADTVITNPDSSKNNTSSTNTETPAASNTNVWFQKNIENVKKATPTKAPPKLSTSKPKQQPPKSNTNTATNETATQQLATTPQVEPKSEPSPAKLNTIRYSDILKAPPPKKSTPPPPAAAPKAIVKAPPKAPPKETTVAPPKAQAKRKKREPILLGDIVIKEQEAKKLPAVKKSTGPPKNKAPPAAVLTMNTATDAIIVKRSKVRETPKPKKFSRLKKLILIERAEKWKSRNNATQTPQNTTDEASVKKDNTKDESDHEDIEELSDEDKDEPNLNNTNVNNEASETKPKITKVKKVPNKFLIREYCDQIITDQLNSKIIALLTKLRELQTKMKQRDAKKAAMKRRFVVGLREVARSVKVSQIKLIILAPDIEESSAPESLDDRVAEILEGAREMSVMCVFGLNRKKLGAALGFKLRMSVVGLSYIDGANELYNEVVECAVKSRILFALQRKVLARQMELRGAELVVPKFEATGHRDEDAQKSKNKIMFTMAKYKNEEKLPDYQKFTTDKLVDLLQDPRSKTQKNSLTLFVQDLNKNKIHLFEDLPPITKVIELKEQLLLRTATAKKRLPEMQLNFHDLVLGTELDEVAIGQLPSLENYSTITLQKNVLSSVKTVL